MPRPFVRELKWNRYEKKMLDKGKLKRLSEFGNHAPACPVGDDENMYYKRLHKPNDTPCRKRLASRKFRNFTGDLPNGCGYKKTFSLRRKDT